MDDKKEIPLPSLVLTSLKDMGRCTELLREAMKSELFTDLSKHNDFWDAPDEKTSDKLHDIRLQLSALEDKMFEVICILRGDYLQDG